MKSLAAAILLLGLGLSPAAACGWEGERCCSTKKGGESCKEDGLVCIDGRCKVEAECGGNGEACCPGEECDLHSLVCLGGSCTPCGKEGEPVCNEDGVSPCNEGLEPSGGICEAPCGASGETCCPGDKCDAHSLGCVGGTCVPCGKEGEPACTEDGVSPCNEGLEDSDGICTAPCGGNGETCCPGDKCDLHSLGCVGGTCVPCGKEGEPACTEDGVSPCNEGLEESDGICTAPCGGNGETCCPGDKCDAHSLGCVGGTCVPCGKEGEPACTEDGVSPCNEGLEDSDGICTAPCGGNGETCCPGDKCDLHSLGCVGGTCTPCGKEGEPTCTENGVSPCNEGLEDSDGTCTAPCGGSGETCCPGDKCDAHSLGCVGGTCVPCGKEGEPTCTEDGVSPCNEGLEDSDGTCTAPCGGNGETCCPGDKCDAHSLGCVGGTCVPCGKEGEPTCTEDGVSPCNEGLEDSDGICTAPCGGNGETCCPGDKCDAHSLGCVGGTCVPCGKEGEPACTEDGVSPCNEGLEESDGICVPLDCGEKNEECCPGDVCGTDLECSKGFCLPCGTIGDHVCTGEGVPPCAGDLVVVGGLCAPATKDCGKGARCCPGDVCEDADTICRNGFCSACGELGQPACAGDEPCEDDLEVSPGGLCIAGKKLSFGFKKL